jgi:hypothetical protein
MPLVKIRLYLDGKGIDADVFLAETAFQQEVIARRVTCAVEGRQVSLVTADDLILFKLIASRPRDLIDVQDVLFTQGDLDEAYMRRWAALAAAARQTNPNRWIASGFINEGSERAPGYLARLLVLAEKPQFRPPAASIVDFRRIGRPMALRQASAERGGS